MKEEVEYSVYMMRYILLYSLTAHTLLMPQTFPFLSSFIIASPRQVWDGKQMIEVQDTTIKAEGSTLS